MLKCKHVLYALGRQHLSIALIAFGSAAVCQAGQGLTAPLARWSFESLEALGGEPSLKHPFRFVEGVLDKALMFEGSFTDLSVSPEQSPVLSDRFAISAWVAPQEYSYNLSAIINRQQNFQKGYFFGINHIGQLVGSLALGSGWTTSISTRSLPLLKWFNVASGAGYHYGVYTADRFNQSSRMTITSPDELAAEFNRLVVGLDNIAAEFEVRGGSE